MPQRSWKLRSSHDIFHWVGCCTCFAVVNHNRIKYRNKPLPPACLTFDCKSMSPPSYVRPTVTSDCLAVHDNCLSAPQVKSAPSFECGKEDYGCRRCGFVTTHRNTSKFGGRHVEKRRTLLFIPRITATVGRFAPTFFFCYLPGVLLFS